VHPQITQSTQTPFLTEVGVRFFENESADGFFLTTIK